MHDSDQIISSKNPYSQTHCLKNSVKLARDITFMSFFRLDCLFICSEYISLIHPSQTEVTQKLLWSSFRWKAFVSKCRTVKWQQNFKQLQDILWSRGVTSCNHFFAFYLNDKCSILFPFCNGCFNIFNKVLASPLV